MNEKRFTEFRRLYLVFPQIAEEILNVLPLEITQKLITAELDEPIRRTLSGESDLPIRRTVSGELQVSENKQDTIKIPARLLLNKLPYSHIDKIASIENPIKRAFYAVECAKGVWSFRELERQINSLYYERSGMSKNKKLLSELTNTTAIQLAPRDIINTPAVLEFLQLSDRALVTENDLEQAILDHLQMFLLEMGHGFCFEARQKRILIDNEYFFVDLLFYHRILKCHIVVELKTDKFRHEYASQLNMYLNYFKNEETAPDDNQPVGILLCTEKGNTQVKYATAGMDENLFVQKYLIELPDEQTLKNYIEKEIKYF
jgi:predicted nuclease of restriction endonuclease-like (RecB) superfamily